MTWTRNKTLVTIVLYLVLALATQLFFQRYGTKYLDSALVKATASYALARGLNGVITVVQESSVSAGFVVEGNIAVGQILDPVNDLVEHFSWIMLLSVVALGVQKLLVVVGVRAGVVLFGAALLVLLVRWLTTRGQPQPVQTGGLGQTLLVLAIFVQAAIPITSSIGAAVSDTFLAQRYTQAEAAITEVQQSLTRDLGLGEGRWYERFDPRRLAESVAANAGDMTRYVIDLMIIFIFETVLMPLLTLLLLLFIFGPYLFWGSSPRAQAPLPAGESA